MKHFVTWIACLCLGVPCLCQAQTAVTEGESTEPVVLKAIAPDEPTVNFVNNQTEEFTALVGQIIQRKGLVRFADAEIPPIPDPVLRSPAGLNMDPDISATVISGDYSVSIQGPDRGQFRAVIVKTSFTSNECTLNIFYVPTSEGVHTATVVAECANAGVPIVNIPVVGVASGILGDINSDGLVTIVDVTGMINLLLTGKKDVPAGDIDGDGTLTVRDVTSQINRLLTNQ